MLSELLVKDVSEIIKAVVLFMLALFLYSFQGACLELVEGHAVASFLKKLKEESLVYVLKEVFHFP